MKKILTLAFLVVGSMTFMNAQDAAPKKACTKSAKSCAKTCSKKASQTKVASVLMEADVLAETDANIEKRVCEKSGATAYYQKSVCEKSGKVAWNEVSYCTKSKAFKAVASGEEDIKVIKTSAKEGKACAKGAKSACCKKGAKSTKVASASKSKACCAKGDKKACTKKETKVASAVEVKEQK